MLRSRALTWLLPLVVAFPLTTVGNPKTAPEACGPGGIRHALGQLLQDSPAPENGVISSKNPEPPRVASLPSNERASFTEGKFPYASGSKRSDNVRAPPPGLAVEIPEVLEGAEVDLAEINISRLPTHERLRIAAGDARINFHADGGLSRVYLAMPQGHLPYIIKLRLRMEHLGDWANALLHRDLVLEKVAEQLTQGALLHGKRFLRVGKNLATKAERLSGTLKMEYVEGPSADKLADAVARLGVGPHADSKRLLEKAGLTVEQAQELLAALEHFYSETHADVIRFQDSADLARPFKNVSNAFPNNQNKNMIVGLDYNHGQNVIWSAKERMFVMIDW